MFTIRPAETSDREAVWAVIEPIIRTGDVYARPREMSKEDALANWFSNGHEVFVAEDEHGVVGTYYLRANQRGGGDHVANCGYATAPSATGRGVARAMCAHSLDRARERGFRAMQFNFVISTNERAVRLWQRFGFEIVGRLPKVFQHPQHGFVDAFVMYREL
ncbi:MAG: GNAT family N-acetyltransferase [Silvibacterium sp.]|nr:GNAT family N-acetyltransferase [Silvibacterium sp.]